MIILTVPRCYISCDTAKLARGILTVKALHHLSLAGKHDKISACVCHKHNTAQHGTAQLDKKLSTLLLKNEAHTFEFGSSGKCYKS